MKSAAMVEELKKELRKRNITYGELAKRVGLSVPAIKRAFALRNFSLTHLDQFCEAIGLDIGDLVGMTRRAEEQPKQLSEAAEEELAADPELLLALYYLLLRTPLPTIRKKLGTDKEGFYKTARRLERIGLVEVQPGDQVRVKVRKSICWRADGPLTKRYMASIQAEFFATNFKGEHEHQDFRLGALTPDSYRILKRKIVELFRQFDELTDLDAATAEDRTEGFWLYAGVRPWAPLAVVQRAVQ